MREGTNSLTTMELDNVFLKKWLSPRADGFWNILKAQCVIKPPNSIWKGPQRPRITYLHFSRPNPPLGGGQQIPKFRRLCLWQGLHSWRTKTNQNSPTLRCPMLSKKTWRIRCDYFICKLPWFCPALIWIGSFGFSPNLQPLLNARSPECWDWRYTKTKKHDVYESTRRTKLIMRHYGIWKFVFNGQRERNAWQRTTSVLVYDTVSHLY